MAEDKTLKKLERANKLLMKVTAVLNEVGEENGNMEDVLYELRKCRDIVYAEHVECKLINKRKVNTK